MSTKYNLLHPKEDAYATDIISKAAIKDAWEMFDDSDISTERLLQLVADACNCTVSDVVDAIAAEESND